MNMDQEPTNILSCARRLRMLSGSDSVLAAVSGGADSTAMLHALLQESQTVGFSLKVCHVNHSLRQSATRDQLFVESMCSQLGLECISRVVDVPAMLPEGGGVEEAARKARYSVLDELAQRLVCNKIAVAHNADDVAETLLLNVVRGAGLEGLASIKPVRGKIIRPLLDTSRKQIEQYLQSHNLDYVTDETNSDLSYARNRVRNELLPYLEQHFNPNVKQALKRLASIAHDTYLMLCEEAKSARLQIYSEEGYSCKLFNALARPLRQQILREEIARCKQGSQDISFEQVSRLLDCISDLDRFRITLPGATMEIICANGAFNFRETAPLSQPDYLYHLQVPGQVLINSTGHVIRASIIELPENLKRPLSEALLDCEKIAGDLTVRNARPGDKIVPFGMSGSKKLQDVFVDKHLPERRRWQWPVVADSQKIVWVPGLTSSQLTSVSATTRQVLRLIFEENPA